jgi:hypothetical protein
MPSHFTAARRLALALALTATAFAAGAQHDPAQHSQHGAAAAADPRELVKFPADMKLHTLTNMRDHLLALQQIQQALAEQKFADAANIAEQRLGLSSLKLHGAHEVAKFMPQGMQDVGTTMHRSASQFALQAQEASATGDLGKTLSSLSRLTATCVACHAGYRLQ